MDVTCADFREAGLSPAHSQWHGFCSGGERGVVAVVTEPQSRDPRLPFPWQPTRVHLKLLGCALHGFTADGVVWDPYIHPKGTLEASEKALRFEHPGLGKKVY